MVFAVVYFEDRVPTVEMVARYQARGFELCQYPVHRRERDFFARIQQHLIYIFRFEMPVRGAFQQLEDFHTGQGNLETRVLDVSCFHMMLSHYLQQAGGDSIIALSLAIVANMNLRSLQTGLLVGLAIITFSGCVYRMDVPQGNRIDPTLVKQLRIGMSRNQVEFLLGTSALVDLYHPDRWHYIYFLKTGDDGSIEKRVMTLTFSGDLLTNIDGTLSPG